MHSRRKQPRARSPLGFVNDRKKIGIEPNYSGADEPQSIRQPNARTIQKRMDRLRIPRRIRDFETRGAYHGER